MVAANRREKAGRLESLGVAGSLANKGFQDYSGLDTSAEVDNSIPAASTISSPCHLGLSARHPLELSRQCHTCCIEERAHRSETLVSGVDLEGDIPV